MEFRAAYDLFLIKADGAHLKIELETEEQSHGWMIEHKDFIASAAAACLLPKTSWASLPKLRVDLGPRRELIYYRKCKGFIGQIDAPIVSHMFGYREGSLYHCVEVGMDPCINVKVACYEDEQYE